MSTTLPGAAPPVVDVVDDRLAHVSLATKMLRRPELGAAIAAAAVAIFFAVTTDQFMTLDGISNWTDVASTIGIPASLACCSEPLIASGFGADTAMPSTFWETIAEISCACFCGSLPDSW